MAVIPDRLPLPLSTRAKNTIQSIASRNGRPLDYALAGIPFLAATSKDLPMSVSTADMKKSQVDVEPEPGEHTLTGWWVRSQNSWHIGAGNKYQEITDQYGDADVSYRFYDSQNIDPWTKGELRLLRKPIAVPSALPLRCVTTTGGGPILGGGDGFMALFNTDGSGWDKLGGAYGTDEIVDIVQLGSNLYMGAADGKLDVYDNTSGTPAQKSLLLSTTVPAGQAAATATNPRLLLAKYRMWACAGRFVYEKAIADIDAAVDGDTVASLFVNPDPRWTYTDLTEGPSAIYVSGYSAGGNSCIQKITLDSSGAVPTLTDGVTTAVMPPGEIVYRIAVMAGSYMGIGTNRGFRLGQLNSSGDITYGPLVMEVEPRSASSLPRCYAVEAHDRFFYASFFDGNEDGRTYAFDVSQQANDGTCAYARFVETGSGFVRDLTVCPDGRLAVATVAADESPTAPMVQDVSTLCDSGWVNFGYVRFRMQEPKLFKRIGLDAEPLRGSIAVDVVVDDTVDYVATYNDQGVGSLPEMAVPRTLGARVQVALKLTLAPSTTDATLGPVIHSYWLKAIPAVKPQRIWQVAMMCYDRERYRSGQEYGYTGFALDRLAAVQAAEDSQDVIMWQDFRTETPIGRQVVIDKLQYVEQVPEGSGVKGNGGILVATLRTLD